MTVWYDADRNAIVENNGRLYGEFTENGELVLDVDEMPPNKLENMKGAVEDAIDAQEP